MAEISTVTFRTREGEIVPAVNVAQMRELDRICVDETGPNLYQMMEHAGRSLAELVLERVTGAVPVVVLAGPGGNGGGGICAARHLANRGLPVLLCLAQSGNLRGVTADQRAVFSATSGSEITPEQLDDTAPGIILDALLGYSLLGEPEPPYDRLIAWANESGAPIVALDLPSGLDPTTGEILGACIRATATLTLALPKTGLASAAGREHAGELHLADLGIPAEAYARLGIALPRVFGRGFRVRIV